MRRSDLNIEFNKRIKVYLNLSIATPKMHILSKTELTSNQKKVTKPIQISFISAKIQKYIEIILDQDHTQINNLLRNFLPWKQKYAKQNSKQDIIFEGFCICQPWTNC